MKLSLLLHILPFAVIPFIAEGTRDSDDEDAAGPLEVDAAVGAEQLVDPDELIEGLLPATTDVLASADFMKQLRFELCYAEVKGGKVRLNTTFTPPENERKLKALFEGLVTDIVTIGQGLVDNWNHNVAVQEDEQGPYLDNKDGFFKAWLEDRCLYFREGKSVLVLAPKKIALMLGHLARQQGADFDAVFFPEGFGDTPLSGDYFNLMIHFSIYTLVDTLAPEYLEYWGREDMNMSEDAVAVLEKCKELVAKPGLELTGGMTKSLQNSLLELQKVSVGTGTQRSGMSPTFGAGLRPVVTNYATFMGAFTASGALVGALEKGAGDCITLGRVARGQMTAQQAALHFKPPGITAAALRSGAEGAFAPSTMAAGGVMGGPGYLSHMAGGYGERAALDALGRMQNVLVRHAPQTAKMVGATHTPVAGNFMRSGVTMAIWGAYFHLDKELMGGAENLSPSQKAMAAVTAGHQLTMTMAAYEHGARAPQMALRSASDALANPAPFVKQGLGRIAKTGMANTKQFAILTIALTAVEKLDRSG